MLGYGKMIKTTKLVVLVLALTVSGCAHEAKDAVLLGDACIVHNDFCDAIAHYRKALTISPDISADPKFTENFQYARKECAKSHYKTGMDFSAKQQLDDAAEAFKTALTIDPDNKKVRQALEQVLNVKADNIMVAVDNYKDGMAFAANKDWRNAIKQFRLTLSINPNHTQAQEQIDRALQQISQANAVYNRALLLFEKKKWDDAVRELKKVLASDPVHPDASGKLHIAQAELSDGEECYARGDAALKQGKRPDALLLFKKAVSHNPGHTAALAALADIYYLIAAEQAEKKNVGTAVLFYTKTLDLLPNHKDAGTRVAPLKDEIRQRITCNLAVVPLKEYSRDPELSNAFYTILRNKMVAGEKGFIRIIDNKPLEKLAEEKDIPVEKLSEGKNTGLLKALPEVSAVLTGKVAAFKITTDKKTENRSKQYQSGTNRRRNPEYDAAVANARLANQAAEATRRAAAQAGGIFDLLGKVVSSGIDANASLDVANTPEYIEEPAYSTWRYKVIHHKKKAEMALAFRFVDAQTGELLADESIPTHMEVSADSVENPNPEIGIEDKPLPFDSDDDLKTALIAKAADHVVNTLAVTLQKYANKYLLAAQRFDAATDRVQAVENYMNFVYAVPGDSSTYANELKKVREYLESVTIDN